MSESAVVSFRTSPKTKRRAEKIFDDMGMSMSTAINMFLKQTIRTKALPFQPAVNDWVEEVEFDEEMIAAIDEADAILRGEIEAKSYHNMKELMEDLNANVEA